MNFIVDTAIKVVVFEVFFFVGAIFINPAIRDLIVLFTS
jgi:hypothetical protein